MKPLIPGILLASLLLGLTACVTTPPMACAPEVRKLSCTDSTLFKDSLNGLFLFDSMFSPKAQKREVVKIEVIVPYDNRRVGVERWTIRHDDQDTTAYIVKMIPDGNGGTNFNVGKDDGKALRGIPLLPPPQK